MTTKVTTRQSGIKSREEYEARVNACAELEVQLRAAAAEQDAALQSVRDQYEGRITRLSRQRDSLLDACALYASMHQGEVLRPGTRSGETAKAVYGFNLGNPTLVLLSRKVKWQTVIDNILAKGKDWAAKYLTQATPKPNKDKLKAELSDAELAELGCRIEQTDAYYIKAKDNTEA